MEYEEKIIKKIQKCLSKRFELRKIGALYEDKEHKKIPKKKHFFMDVCNVCGIGFTDKDLEEWFYRTFDVTTTKAPELDYTTKKKSNSKSKYSIEYVFPFIELCNILNVSPILQIKEDYPLTIEAEEFFKVIIAPRVNN